MSMSHDSVSHDHTNEAPRSKSGARLGSRMHEDRMSGIRTPSKETQNKFSGALVWGVILVIIAFAGGYYAYTRYMSAQHPPTHQVVANAQLPAPNPPLNVEPSAPPPVTAIVPNTPYTGPNSALAHSPYCTMSMNMTGCSK